MAARKRTRRGIPPYSEEDIVEQIFGQAMAGLGQGAGGVRVSLEAVALARFLCLPVISRGTAHWSERAPEALEVVAAMGRASAMRATAEGRYQITADDLLVAGIRVVWQRTVGSICLLLRRVIVVHVPRAVIQRALRVPAVR